jgi:hypothetical protein
MARRAWGMVWTTGTASSLKIGSRNLPISTVRSS